MRHGSWEFFTPKYKEIEVDFEVIQSMIIMGVSVNLFRYESL